MQNATDGRITPDLSLSGQISASLIPRAAPSTRLLPVAVDALHRSAARPQAINVCSSVSTSMRSVLIRRRHLQYCPKAGLDTGPLREQTRDQRPSEEQVRTSALTQ